MLWKKWNEIDELGSKRKGKRVQKVTNKMVLSGFRLRIPVLSNSHLSFLVFTYN